MNLFPTHASVAIGACVLFAATLTGCGAGQQSQTATQEPAVNGASSSVGTIALRDVRIRVQQTSASVDAGQSVDLLFVAANQSPGTSVKLVSITSDFGDVKIVPESPAIPAARNLNVGKMEGADAESLQALSNAVQATATVTLKKPISNGLTYPFVFTFEPGGRVTVPVPVTAGDTASRLPEPSLPGGGHGGH